MITIHLKKGRDKPVRSGHPWIFSGALSRVEGAIAGAGVPGEACTVLSSSGEALGSGYYNPASAISVRMLSSGKIPFTVSDLKKRIDRAVDLREKLIDKKQPARTG